MAPRLLAALALALASIASTIQAQDRWGFDLRGGFAVATQDPTNVSLDPGFGFEGTLAYRLQPHLSAYTGWDWHRFTADGFAGANSDFEETGYAQLSRLLDGEADARGVMIREVAR